MRYISLAIRRIFFHLAKFANFKDDYKTVSVAQSKNLELSPQNVHNEPLLWLHLADTILNSRIAYLVAIAKCCDSTYFRGKLSSF